MKRTLMIIMLFSCVGYLRAQHSGIDLSGEWQLALDPDDVGISQRWFERDLELRISLPGSLTTAGYGEVPTFYSNWVGKISDKKWFNRADDEKWSIENDPRMVFWLTPQRYYNGPAWYSRIVEIPSQFSQGKISLELERCHWETTLWVDGRLIDMRNSLSVPHVYDDLDLPPGPHRITLRVDNRIKDIDPGIDSHSVSDHTQGNWNGIIGSIKLRKDPSDGIASVRLTPDVNKRSLQIDARLYGGRKGTLTSRAVCLTTGRTLPEKEVCTAGDLMSFEYPMGDDMLLWDEFSPNLYRLEMELRTAAGIFSHSEIFGMREMGIRGSQITVNGRPVFFRGTLECCIFPETGYPPTDEPSWERIINICREYGLNHIRFHSWCPPDAAFRVADRLGFYFHIECGSWSYDLGSGRPIDAFVMAESQRIVNRYGNHPSFVLFSYGNEPGGPNRVEFLRNFVNHWKQQDRRFLTTTGAGWPEIAESDWISTPDPRIQRTRKGLNSEINGQQPSTAFDWSAIITAKAQPVISHEIGQWCVYPDLDERQRYKGLMKAINFDVFEDRLKESGLLHLANDFKMASGKLQALCYKADIEAAFRTPGMAGFQLLDLHDFPGQGTALVGVLDPFWENKGYITAAQYRSFCSPIVPLARIQRLVLTSGENLEAGVEIVQFTAEDLFEKDIYWTLRGEAGTVQSGSFHADRIPTGTVTRVGGILQQLYTDVPVQYELEVWMDEYRNTWDIWVYPDCDEKPQDVLVSTSFDDECISYLSRGGKVLLSPEFGSLRNEGRDSVTVGFSTIFWNTLWFDGGPPHTMGILCDSSHPALKGFPTEYHSNYQWYDAMSRCNALPLHRFGDGFEPIVRIIDDWFSARSLGMIAEMKVAEGKLVICGADLLSDKQNRPGARQLLNSLIAYMNGDDFDPVREVTPEVIGGLFKR